VGVFTPPPFPKKIKNVIFSCFFRFFAYGLIHIFTIFAHIIYHKKNIKTSSKKNTKKNGKKVFKILFYFLKMDKNKCPKFFLKKKFQKTGIFCFFSLITKNTILSPKIAILVLKTKKSFFGDKLLFFQ
jgi:hypothetical protein